ncbi:MAG: NAD(P)H-binding protein [Gammaproteobacteria bacterium]|jgi:NAD(P)H dehydrogenase (quinone)|nr:NAD(P)-dependent oxidoreductase [Chromatiales bacterium]MDP7093947.1 NAD(P)H-binding protein [Gammaproteobacteria bacterium]MDP7270344.1 NAD(P)H-binding protein [Gammaproteobacteria bacterium]MDP7661574.1 NAD(P)H-binding protein [Gammaproteobacteria bacterium]HJP04497.1 NAD(P)H-binding protein [Gammaproteobacteria bacterium]
MKIAVTAASGRLGHALLPGLVAIAGADQVIGIARDPERLQLSGIEKRSGDYESEAQMTAALRGADTAVMISAPVAGTGDRIAMHRNVINAAKSAGVRKLIFTGVIGNGREEGTYFFDTQQVNRQAEDDLQASGLDWIVGRNGLYLELDLVHIKLANEAGGVYRNNGGDGRCGYISIDELAFAYTQLATSDRCNGEIVNLVGETYTQAELIDMANQVFNLDVRFEPITVEQNIEKFMAYEPIAARGLHVAQMLTGCFQCIAKGAFDVDSDFERVAGRPPLSLRQQMEAMQ